MPSTDTPSSSINMPIENLGAPGVKGALHVLDVMENEQRQDQARLHDQSERQFKVTGRLSKSPPTAENIQFGFGPEDGTSYLVLPDHAIFMRVRCKEGMFEIKKNSHGEQSLVEFECIATSTTNARKKFQSAALPFLDYLAYVANCPIVISTLRFEDTKNNHTTIEYISPYRKVSVNPGISDLLIELAPVYAMYREAKNSNSDFYKFLCHYKILEGLLGTLRANIFTRARDQGLTLQRQKETIPPSPDISMRFQTYVEKPIKTFFDVVMRPQFRNAVAHFVTDDGAILNMSDPDHIDNYTEILFISELCVRTMIESHEKLLKDAQCKPRA